MLVMHTVEIITLQWTILLHTGAGKWQNPFVKSGLCEHGLFQLSWFWAWLICCTLTLYIMLVFYGRQHQN